MPGGDKWREVLPPAIVEATTRDGTFYAVPVNIHGENWLFYNNKVLADAGLQPPKTFAELVAMGPKLKEEGVIPLAHGGQGWQEHILFNAVLLAEAGARRSSRSMAKATSRRSRVPSSARPPTGSPSCAA